MRESPPKIDPLSVNVLGEISWLMLHSPVHSKYPVQAIYARFLKAFQLGQGHLYYAKHIPVGVVTWARVSSYWHEKLISNDNLLLPEEEWKSGDILWFMEFIAPFGHITEIRKKLRKIFPSDHKAWAHRIDPNTGKPSIIRLYSNRNYIEKID